MPLSPAQTARCAVRSKAMTAIGDWLEQMSQAAQNHVVGMDSVRPGDKKFFIMRTLFDGYEVVITGVPMRRVNPQKLNLAQAAMTVEQDLTMYTLDIVACNGQSVEATTVDHIPMLDNYTVFDNSDTWAGLLILQIEADIAALLERMPEYDPMLRSNTSIFSRKLADVHGLDEAIHAEAVDAIEAVRATGAFQDASEEEFNEALDEIKATFRQEINALTPPPAWRIER